VSADAAKRGVAVITRALTEEGRLDQPLADLIAELKNVGGMLELGARVAIES
jgi:hypothetical protein